jgi:lipopolysaccharide transport system permease protein
MRFSKRHADSAAPAWGSDVRPIIVREPPHPSVIATVRRVWHHRRVIGHVGHRFLMKRYARTWLGIAWIPLRPIISLGSKILVFGGLVGITSGSIPYPLFFVVATGCWQLFSDSAIWSVRSIELNKPLLRRVEFPRLALVVAAAVPALAEFLTYIAIAAAGCIYYFFRGGYTLSLSGRFPLLPLGLLALIMLGLGVGVFAAGLGARARDIRFGMNYGLGFLYFVTPVIYPMSTIPPKWRPLAELNPATGAIEMAKDGIFWTHSLSVPAALVSVVAVVVTWTLGLVFFSRREARALAVAVAGDERLPPTSRALEGQTVVAK